MTPLPTLSMLGERPLRQWTWFMLSRDREGPSTDLGARFFILLLGSFVLEANVDMRNPC